MSIDHKPLCFLSFVFKQQFFHGGDTAILSLSFLRASLPESVSAASASAIERDVVLWVQVIQQPDWDQAQIRQ